MWPEDKAVERTSVAVRGADAGGDGVLHLGWHSQAKERCVARKKTELFLLEKDTTFGWSLR